MKIAILTQPLGNNYGGNIQNWALQQVLKRMGHQPVTINLTHSFKNCLRDHIWALKDFVWAICTRYIRRDWTKFVNNPFALSYRSEQPIKLDNTFRRKIARTPEIVPYGNWTPKAAIGSFDAFIVGSDQVWRQDYSPRIETFFLDFLADDDHRPRIAYAASFGRPDPIGVDKLPQCAELLCRFVAVSVREHSGLDTLRTLFGYDGGQKTLDPTLLLSAADYAPLIRPRHRHTHPFIGCYILDKDEEKDKIVGSICRREGLPAERISIGYEGFHHPSMSEWLAMFADAKVVVTDSFHGCVFSILFHRPFVAIANAERGLDRFDSLLRPLGLINRLMFTFEEFKAHQSELTAPIDWPIVDRRLDAQRAESLRFLKRALESCQK